MHSTHHHHHHRFARLTTPLALVTLLCLALPAHAEVVTKDVAYTHADTNLQGYLARDEARDDYKGAVLIVHEWWGLSDYPKRRARQLAELGYIAFALDMYGKNKNTESPKQAGQWSAALYKNRNMLRARAQAGLDQFRQTADLGDTPVAAIGYCFGGTVVADLAWSGADLAGVVSFHGNPKQPTPGDLEQLQASVLICHGAADTNVSAESMNAYTDALTEANADWMKITYAHAKHAFTNPGADAHGIDSVGYNKTADQRSWQHMLVFFDEIFGD